ncbi:putative bifunctional diguanylate cyclase/phosphodiesterase [Jiella mangrovi]|uniref:EAL domain-containing protein n=1 Tax=Jiella mangrovi TaxID=2821407 RepID=A0ABS4BLE2_9HYPH|nr:EAL domain-containing protein [Jiella mangrovi]MBP0617552.1 EAL domain-containing protein [Jiella mangrovi]
MKPVAPSFTAGTRPGQSGKDDERVWLDQLDLVLSLAPFTILTGSSVALIVSIFFWDWANVVYLAGLQAIDIGLLLLTSSGWLVWRRARKQSRPIPVRAVRARLICLAAMAGVILASIPVALFAGADADGRLLIACTCAGLIAIGISIGFVPAAGLAYSVPIMIGSFIALAMTGESFYIFVALLLAIYSAFIIATIVKVGRLVGLRTRVQIDLDRQREVSDLLLNDFEKNASDWLWETDAAGRIQHPSNRFVDVAQKSRCYLDKLPLTVLLARTDEESSPQMDRLFAALAARRPFHRLRVPVRIAAEKRWWCLTGKPIYNDDGVFAGFRGVGSDVTLEHEYIARLDYLANHDVLTNLLNRRGFETTILSDATVNGETKPGADYAVMCLDLDRFKQVNDTFGHGVGDELLQEIGTRLLALSGPDVVVSRFSGDEFAIFHRAADLQKHIDLAKRVVAILEEPFHLDCLDIEVGTSIGIALSSDGGTFGEVLRKADAALYRMKETGGAGYILYDPSMDERKAERAALMGDLRGGLEREEFRLDYQPFVSAASGAIVGFEALMRWTHPVHGNVPPSEFIALAEETGTIVALGEWGLRTACRFAATWPDRSLSIAVNVSTVQIRHSNLVEVVKQALAESGLEVSRLELEITETAFLAATCESREVLDKLVELGVRLVLDDFGTGYSSLSYLRQFPLDKLKIDRSFTADLPGSQTDVSIVRTIVELGRHLGMTTIAEGVESPAQGDCLRRIGCEEFQGYLFGRPASAAQTLDLLEKASRQGSSAIV